MAQEMTTRCLIAGGGPAGLMLGFLLARAGVDTIVAEKHKDFLRDFRGDTIHPSTLEIMHELGLLEDFLKLPHQKVAHFAAQIGDERLEIADLRHLPTRCKFMVFMPQWDFLDFVARMARRHPTFTLLTRAEVTSLVEEGDTIAGARITTADGPLAVHADLVIGADGRHSTVRAEAHLRSEDLGAPMDVLWLRISKLAADPSETMGHIEAGRVFIMLDRGNYWQCAFVIPKGGAEDIRNAGLPAFRSAMLELSPWLGQRVEEIASWEDAKLLTVAVDRLKQWYRPGLLCIGDAAHAMSPIGGVGINLAIQDAVAAANVLAAPLRAGMPTLEHLRAVQARREWPTRATQGIQLFLQNRVIGRVLQSRVKPKAPAPLKLLRYLPYLRRIPARLIGLGIRPEHVRSPVA
jgi:2-polyprenyl-6-methoxyphenol hydroxylase-like FAD-dependent oxidoreductase